MTSSSGPMLSRFERTKQGNVRLIAVFYVLDIALVLLAVALFATSLLDPIELATRGLANVTLVVNVAIITVVVGLLLFGIGRLRPRDVGLIRSNMPVALAMTAFLWLAAQAAEGLISLVQTGTVTLNPAWAERSATVVLGWLIAQLFGNALYEEIVFRGFLLPQVYLKLGKWRERPGLRLGVAVAISQVMFALIHIPIRIYGGTDAASLALNLLYLAFLGSFFAFVYLRTGNLFFTVGVHALINAPTAVFGSSNSMIILGLGLVLTLLWPVFVPRAGTFYPRVPVPQS